MHQLTIWPVRSVIWNATSLFPTIHSDASLDYCDGSDLCEIRDRPSGFSSPARTSVENQSRTLTGKTKPESKICYFDPDENDQIHDSDVVI